jgi:hypothetical protein
MQSLHNNAKVRRAIAFVHKRCPAGNSLVNVGKRLKAAASSSLTFELTRSLRIIISVGIRDSLCGLPMNRT